MTKVIAHAATVQAWASVAIGVLTLALVAVTATYASFTKRMVEEMRRQTGFHEGSTTRAALDRMATNTATLVNLIDVITPLEALPASTHLHKALAEVWQVYALEVGLLPSLARSETQNLLQLISVAGGELTAGRLSVEELCNILMKAVGNYHLTLSFLRRGSTEARGTLPKREDAIPWLHHHRKGPPY